MKRLIAWEELVSLLEEHRRFISRSPGLDIRGARDGEEMLALHREHQARLLILDVMMPGPSPEEICRSVRADPRLRKVSLIAIGSQGSLPALGQIHRVTEIVRVEPVSGGDPKYGARFIDPSHQTGTLLESFINRSVR